MPLNGMTQKIGKLIGAIIGKVEIVDVNEDNIGWGPFLRIRAQVNITKPLLRGTIAKFKV